MDSLVDATASGLGAFSLIVVAELGDKSQLVILALMARFRDARGVFLGAVGAFVLLNLLAVTVGAASTCTAGPAPSTSWPSAWIR